jgi:S-adenosylmethionine hydrolase
LNPRPVYFLSDFGLTDEFVGVVHAVIASRAPGVSVIDLSHLIQPHDIRTGALTLERAAPWLAGGVILAVVDPGVGTERRPVAVEASDTVLIGPDNGLLLPAAHILGHPDRAVELENRTDAPGDTFAGRDIFAPAAAAAAAGTPLDQLGAPVDPATLVELPLPGPARENRGLKTQVLWIDRFGNAQLNATPLDAGPVTHIELAGGRHPAAVVRSYGEIGDGYALVVDSYGRLAVSANQRNAARELGLTPGDEVWLGRDQ